VKTKVVQLGLVRDLLAEWERVRSRIAAGRVGGFQAVFCDSEGGQEEVFLGGVYQKDVSLATRAQLRISAARVLAEDEPPKIKKGPVKKKKPGLH